MAKDSLFNNRAGKTKCPHARKKKKHNKTYTSRLLPHMHTKINSKCVISPNVKIKL